jgi:hypothetical protein
LPSCCERFGIGVRAAREPASKTAEVAMSGQLALVISEDRMAPAAVWETLPVAARMQVTIVLARLFARLIAEARDE